MLNALRFLSVILLFATPSALHAQEQDARGEKVFNAQQIFLENGLQVVVIPNHRVPVVTHMVWYKVGAADERTGKSGIAHFLEHLLFKGSDVVGGEPLPPGEFSKIVRRHGGNDNAFTGQDYTAYFQSIASDQLERVMRMEAGRMRGANFPPEAVESERKVILEERRQRTDNDPRARFREQMMANAFVNHPYGTPIIGWYHEMEALSHSDAYNFYKRWYAPNNAVLIIAGDAEPEQAFAMAREIYGSVPFGAVPVRKRSVSPPLNSETRVKLEHAEVREPAVQILYRAPSYRQDKEASLALQILEEVMGGGSSSRLYKSLVSEQRIAVSAGVSYQSDAYDDSQIWLYANPAPDSSLEALEAALMQELRILVRDGITDSELNEAKARMQDAAIYARDSLSGPAMVIGRGLTTGSTLDDVEYWPADIQAVTAEQVSDIARAVLDPDNAENRHPVVGTLMPEGYKAPESKQDKQQEAAK